MKKLTVIILAIATSLIFTSCANVPEEVQSKIDTQKTTAVENTQIEYSKDFINVSELFEKTPKTVDLKSNNLTFKGEVDVPNTSVLYKLSLEPNTDYYDNSEKYLKKLSGATGEIQIQNNRMMIPDTEFEAYAKDAIYNDNNNYRFVALRNGSININRFGDYSTHAGEDWCIDHSSFSEPVKIYTNLENLPDDVYKFYDGELSVLQGYEKFKKDFEKFLPLLSENQTMDLKYICVYKYEDADYFQFYLEGTINYKKVPFNHVNIWSQNSAENNNQSVLYTGYQADLMMAELNPNLSELKNSFVVSEELQKYEKVMTFENAWQLLTEKVGKNLKLDICSAELVYVPYFEDINGYGTNWEIYQNEKPEIFGKPSWCFTSRNATSENSSTQQGSVFYVDAINGEIWSYSPYVLVD